MPDPASPSHPKLRALDLKPIIYDGRDHLLVRDPLGINSQSLLIPQPLATALAFLDGTRAAGTVTAGMALRFGIYIPQDEIQQLIHALDLALLLENDRFGGAHRKALAAYREAANRPATLAGVSYPADPEELHQSLAGYEAGQVGQGNSEFKRGRGLISPHIDYSRGGRVYSQVWHPSAEFIRNADLVIILGTDHYGSEDLITLTRQDYATPFGVLPTDSQAVNVLAAALGEDSAFAGELRHLGEHSVELAAVWLHFMRRENPGPILPVLCGSFLPYIEKGVSPSQDPRIETAVSALRSLMAGRQVAVVAAADLAHVGPAFGGPALDAAGKESLQASDTELLERICAGDAEGFYEAIRREGDRHNICGLAPIYLAMQLLGSMEGTRVGYELCPADQADTSVVSVCGVVFT